MPLRDTAQDLFLRSLALVEVAPTIARHLSCGHGTLRVGSDRTYTLAHFQMITLIAAGKAANVMAEAVAAVLSPHLTPTQQLDGIVVAGSPAPTPDPRLRYYVAAHPIPDAASRAAAQDILAHLAHCEETTLVLFLISGGASALLETPLDLSISVEDTATFYRALVHSGLPITAMNCLRKHLSAVKGGRLAEAAAHATQCTLVISDVPGDDLGVVGSGPSLPDTSTASDCRRILDTSQIADHLPPRISAFLHSPNLPETPKANHPAFRNASHLGLLSNADLLREAATLAAAQGFHFVIDNTCDDWDYARAGDYLLDRIRTLSTQHRKLCLLSGGELSVHIPRAHGIGGRNQHFALWCALQLQRSQDPITVLSAGSDGLDGNSPAAGAVIDGTTCDLARGEGLDPEAALRRFDSYTLFHQLGAALVTGPTGNNLRDLRILLAVT